MLGVTRSAMPAWRPFLVEGIHRNLALMSTVFAGLHILGAVFDTYARLGALDVFVPFSSRYRGTWLGLGVVSGYVVATVVLTSWPARRLKRGAWVWIHRGIYAAWILGVVHALGTGSDGHEPLFLFLVTAFSAAVLAAFLGLRVDLGRHTAPKRSAAAGVVAVLAVTFVAVWAYNGPLQPGWARTAGTPPALLQHR